MPRARSPKRDEAYQIYAQYNGKIENRRIAEQLDVDERFISKWKHEDEWVKKSNGVHQTKKGVHRTAEKCTPNTPAKSSSNKKRKTSGREKSSMNKGAETNSTNKGGAPIGNKNAEGNAGGKGGPPKNKKALKTGEYETIFWAAAEIDEDERALLNQGYCKYTQQLLLIDTLKIRERRIMARIAELKKTPGGMVLSSVTKNKNTQTTQYTKAPNDEGKALPGSSNTVCDNGSSHIAVPVLQEVMRMEEALTRVQGRLQNAIQGWHRMELDDAKAAIDRAKLRLHRQRLAGVIPLGELGDDEDLWWDDEDYGEE
ncbi:MAG: phage terminase small subunit [Defluviitaleaceae bacterium]|nr:phage terminase small subunit [Defluviitaleaceae bacterium]